MNRALTNRLLNEYLDGEIGLADKAELERMMAADPALRKQYQDLRRMSLLLGSRPEVLVHPSRFRHKLIQRISAPERMVFTPQRAFAGAMLVALLVVSLTFAIVMYQEKLLGGWPVMQDAIPAASQASGNDLLIFVPVPAEDYFDRLLLETQLGMVDHATLSPFVAQTSVYEGATCRKSNGLSSVHFQQDLPEALRLNVTARQAHALYNLAVELGGEHTRLAWQAEDGGTIPADFEVFYADHSANEPIRLYLEFE